MTGALTGIRVIDFGQYIAGPLTGMFLADQGADVIRVDPPGGPRWDTPANATWNRGKRSIVLDLKAAGDLETARRLIATADVVIENFRPGVMERLGLGAQAMTSANPRLIYCSMPGFASDDPRAGVPAWEGVVSAAFSTYRPRTREGRPTYTPVPIASSYAAFQAAVSIVMSLLVRERDGLGQRIEVPLFDAMFATVGAQVLNAPAADGAGGGPWGPLLCKDGRWVYVQHGNQNYRDFVRAAGLESWEAEGLFDRARLAREPELATEARRRVAELFKTRAAREWEDLISAAGSECSVCYTSAEWLAHPHAHESAMVIQVSDPRYGAMLQPGLNARMSATPGAVRGPAPQLDADRIALFAEADARRPVIAGGAMAARRSALEGLKVLDLTIVLAGPTCGRTLAEFGADVIKIDNPVRGSTVSFHNTINRGKRSILLDLKSQEGRDVFWRLLEDTDVVVQNYRKGKLDRLGLGYDDVRKRKPDIVYASMNAYGHVGSWADRPGHEQLAQAATGMQERFGGDGTPTLQPHAVNDYGTGYMGAFAVALALFHRQRTGQGQHVDTSLAYTALTLQSPFMQDYAGKTWDEPRGQDALGEGPLYRAYAASDGWLFLAARHSDLPRLAKIEGLASMGELEGDDLGHALEERLATESVDTWVARLLAEDIGAHRVSRSQRAVMDDPWVREHGLSMTREHDEIGPVVTSGPGARLSRTPLHAGRPAPKPGADAREILEEAGFGDRYVELVERGIVRMDGVAAG